MGYTYETLPTLDGSDNNLAQQQRQRRLHKYATIGGATLVVIISVFIGVKIIPVLFGGSSHSNATNGNYSSFWFADSRPSRMWLPDGFSAVRAALDKNHSHNYDAEDEARKHASSSGTSPTSILPMVMKMLASNKGHSGGGGGILTALTGGGNGMSLIPVALKTMSKVSAFKRRLLTGANEQCSKHIDQLLTRLVQSGGKDEWALAFFDAMGKPPAGIMDGNPWWFGSYEECAEMQPSVDEKGRERFAGRYCMASIGPPQTETLEPKHAQLPVGLNWAWCIPRTCLQKDFVIIMSNLVHELSTAKRTLIPLPANSNDSGTHRDAVVNWSYCELTPEEWHLDAPALAVIFVIAVFIGLAIIGTFQELLLQYRQQHHHQQSSSEGADDDDNNTVIVHHSLVNKILLSFSIINNGRKILSTTEQDNNQPAQFQPLASLNGIRVLTMIWIIMIHTFIFSPYLFSDVFRGVRHIAESFPFQIILNGHLAVDTFFLLSGTLVVYIFLAESEKRGGQRSVSWFQYYFYRFWRLAPANMVALGIVAGILPLFLNGPVSYFNEIFAPKRCVNSWWTNLLFVNNFFWFDEQCVPWTWYLAIDTQFYILAPLVLVPLVRRGTRAALSVIGGFMAVHMLASFVITMWRNVPMEIFGNTLLQDFDQLWNYYGWYYMQPWGRAGPYLVGLVLGLALYRWRQKQSIYSTPLTLPAWSVLAAYAAMPVFILVPLFFTYSMFQQKTPYSTLVNALYNTFARTIWAFGVSIVIFLCETGYGGFMNTLLTWQALVPLSRLTYCAYLLHIPILTYITGNTTMPAPFSFSIVQFRFCGLLFTTYIAAFAFSLIFEAPMVGLAKALFGGSRHKRPVNPVHVLASTVLPPIAGDVKSLNQTHLPVIKEGGV